MTPKRALREHRYWSGTLLRDLPLGSGLTVPVGTRFLVVGVRFGAYLICLEGGDPMLVIGGVPRTWVDVERPVQTCRDQERLPLRGRQKPIKTLEDEDAFRRAEG